MKVTELIELLLKAKDAGIEEIEDFQTILNLTKPKKVCGICPKCGYINCQCGGQNE